METCDDHVTAFNLPKDICPAASTLIEKSDSIPGEAIFTHDFMFLVKRITSTQMNINSEVTDNWAPTDAKRFYVEHNLSQTYQFDETFMDDGKKSINWYFKGRNSKYMRFLAYRWNHNMAFLTYKERIGIALNMRMTDESAEARSHIEIIEKAKLVRDSLNNQLDAWKAETGIPPQLIALLDGVEVSLADMIENGD